MLLPTTPLPLASAALPLAPAALPLCSTGLPSTLALAAGGPQLSDILFLLATLGAAALAGRAVFDSLFIENQEFKPPSVNKLPSIPLPDIPGLIAKPLEDPVERAELLRFKLQRALKQKDRRAVQMIEADLTELMEKYDLAFGSTNEEAEEEARLRAEDSGDGGA